MLNVACNLGETAGDEEACRRASFFAGDWSSLGPVMRPAEAKPFDVIVMAETVYSPASYDRLRDLICHLQDGCDEAVVYLASKSYYFGVGACREEGGGVLSLAAAHPLHKCSARPQAEVRVTLSRSWPRSITPAK